MVKFLCILIPLKNLFFQFNHFGAYCANSYMFDIGAFDLAFDEIINIWNWHWWKEIIKWQNIHFNWVWFFFSRFHQTFYISQTHRNHKLSEFYWRREKNSFEKDLWVYMHLLFFTLFFPNWCMSSTDIFALKNFFI